MSEPTQVVVRKPARWVRLLLLAGASAAIAAVGVAVVAEDDSARQQETWQSRPIVALAGMDVEAPAGWEVETSTSDMLWLRNDSGGELRAGISPVPAGQPGHETLSVVSAFGDEAAIVREVEGGYALIAALPCSAEPCTQVEMFGYGLSFAEFIEVGSAVA